MSKIAFVFSGQGSQFVGMGKDIIENNKKASKVFDDASVTLGYDLKQCVLLMQPCKANLANRADMDREEKGIIQDEKV